MHVCRQMRAEFRHQYMRHPVKVDYNDATEYVQTFYPVRPSFVHETEDLPGNIQIDMHDVSSRNIVPLLQHLFRFPQLEFEFWSRSSPVACNHLLADYSEMWHAMDSLFRNHVKAWKKHLGTNIGQISFFGWKWLRFQEAEIKHVEVHFKAHTPGVWGYSSGSPGPLDPILEELGLKKMPSDRMVVRMFLGN